MARRSPEKKCRTSAIRAAEVGPARLSRKLAAQWRPDEERADIDKAAPRSSYR